MLLTNKYNELYSKVLKNEVIDSSSYFEFYTFQLLKENFHLSSAGKIKSNQKFENGLPVSHAPAGPDIEVFGSKIAYICECSLKLGAKQFDDEHESVSRHYEEFKRQHGDQYDQILCFFIVPKVSNEISEWYFSLFSEMKIVPFNLVTFTTFMCNLSKVEISEYENRLFALLQELNDARNRKDWQEKIIQFVDGGQ